MDGIKRLPSGSDCGHDYAQMPGPTEEPWSDICCEVDRRGGAQGSGAALSRETAGEPCTDLARRAVRGMLVAGRLRSVAGGSV